ncbi:hypothetical protein [Poriferisphaera sp. WC338]|uniref:hypothetical protein n=1 Tax=Poriferisphaera sp. WC338 TaxID=3425129 RepID=UPI003D81347A
MKRLTHDRYERAAGFMKREVRPLERAMFAYHFEGGEAAVVVRALEGFQNEDGGFGRGLEPDIRMAESSVVATKFALQVMMDVGVDEDEKLVRGGVEYLLEQFDETRRVWPLVGEDVMMAAHAPWWNWDGLEKEFGGYKVNPKAGVARCLKYYEGLVPVDFVNGIIDDLVDELGGADEVLPFFDLVSYLMLLQMPGFEAAKNVFVSKQMKDMATKIVDGDPSIWDGFAVKAIWLAPSPHAPLADVLVDELAINLDYEIDHQGDDGAWRPSWSWGSTFKDEWEKAEREWTGVLTLAMLRSLRDFGQIEGVEPVKGNVFKYHID